ncbi:helix-turn-helix transcriptional regulator [Glycomyces harbinensis]|uniref:Helix-turn-helix domain-containing protein n=1 Tax=Glycomyces harbinensis TaxID=58114 RepID=A0A1G6XEM7_9ACTN|nr:helix-turn-helix transcriptional regulator [Glycomyces harbinensis]SDD76620.1 Helix-turn-helix domain-containing protein [Glycomyces harbinensis]
MTASRSGFGALLRAWRDRLSPADAGFTVTSGRRAPGLRREELAELAGLSVEYVLRLEQGRAKHPSAQVVGALARALQLTRAERDRLYRGAGLLPPRDGMISASVPPSIQRLAARLGDVPIGVFTADWTLAWWNAMWCALHGDPAALPASERNLARALFGGGPARAAMLTVHSERGQDAFETSIVMDLKDAASRYPADDGLEHLVGDLRGTSAAFARIWDMETDAAPHATDSKTIRHPVIGDIRLDCDVLNVPGEDLHLVTYTAAAGSTHAGKLDLLRTTGAVPAPLS